MGQVFRYPNIVSGTDPWTGWWTPKVGIVNSSTTFYQVDLGRGLAVGDVLTLTVDLEFDKLDLTGSGAFFCLQGTAALEDGKYQWIVNPLLPYSCVHSGSVFDGVEHISLRNVITEKNGMKDGKGIRYAKLGCRCDKSGGGSLRVRRLMVELNAEGAPHAWAPAEGEVWPR